METSTLSQLTPPDVPKGFDHRLHDAVEAETLGSMQLESVVCASMKHEQRQGGRRAGFFLGDGPGGARDGRSRDWSTRTRGAAGRGRCGYPSAETSS